MITQCDFYPKEGDTDKPAYTVRFEEDTRGCSSRIEQAEEALMEEHARMYPRKITDHFRLVFSHYAPSNNREFLTTVMDRSKYGPLMEIMIMERIVGAMQDIATHPDEVRAQMKASGADQMFHPEGWIGCAQEFMEHYDKFTKRHGAPD